MNRSTIAGLTVIFALRTAATTTFSAAQQPDMQKLQWVPEMRAGDQRLHGGSAAPVSRCRARQWQDRSLPGGAGRTAELRLCVGDAEGERRAGRRRGHDQSGNDLAISLILRGGPCARSRFCRRTGMSPASSCWWHSPSSSSSSPMDASPIATRCTTPARRSPPSASRSAMSSPRR